MGNFYVNHTLFGPTQEQVTSALVGKSAAVLPARNRCVVVCEEQSDSQTALVITDLGKELSRKLSCPVLAVMNHDDDILVYWLFEEGQIADEYNSNPDYFEETEDHRGPTGGDAVKLIDAMGVGSDAAAVEEILRAPGDEYVFAFMRHAALIAELEISELALCCSYSSIAEGSLPDGVKEKEIVRTK